MASLRTLLTGTTINSTSTDAGLLVLRLFTGLALAFAHGLGKVPVSPKFVAGVAEMGFPAPALFAWLAAGAELAGGILLAIGLFTRPSAFFIAVTMGIAGFVRHADDPFSSKEKAFLFCAAAIVFLLAGAGRYSVDAMMRGGGRR
jgi:putative oxidoreductase